MLDDVLKLGLKVVFCGSAVGTKSATVGAYYAGTGNKFWPTLHTIGFTPRLISPQQYRTILDFDLGLTDIVKTRSGNDAALEANDFDVAGLQGKMLTYAPRIVAFNGKKAAAAYFSCGTGDVSYGLHKDRIGHSAIFVLPSTSGSARGFWDLKFWHELAGLFIH